MAEWQFRASGSSADSATWQPSNATIIQSKCWFHHINRLNWIKLLMRRKEDSCSSNFLTAISDCGNRRTPSQRKPQPWWWWIWNAFQTGKKEPISSRIGRRWRSAAFPADFSSATNLYQGKSLYTTNSSFAYEAITQIYFFLQRCDSTPNLVPNLLKLKKRSGGNWNRAYSLTMCFGPLGTSLKYTVSTAIWIRRSAWITPYFSL